MIKKIFFLLFLTVHFSFQEAEMHKFYMSITDINYSEKDKTLQVISRLFVDDFQKIINERYDKEVILSNKSEKQATNTYIEDYFNKKLIIYVNQQQLSLNFVGKRYEDDLIICYFESSKTTAFTSAEVTNEILLDAFEDQKNIVHFKKINQEKSLLLQKDNTRQTINFN